MTSVVEHLSRLIRIPSVSALSNRGVIKYADGVLRTAGWQTKLQVYADKAQVEKVNLVAGPPGASLDEAAELAFVCHTDTVPYSDKWQAALEPVEKDGFIHGCGACDVKGFLACLLTAVEGSEAGNVRILLTADEETGCVGAKHLAAAGLVKAKRMIVGEPTLLQPARAGKGYCLGNVTVTGQEAHSAHPEMGASAILGAAHLLVALEGLGTELMRETNELFTPPFTTLNAGTIRGGSAKNIIPGECSFLVEWRPVPGEDVAGKIEDVIAREREKNVRLRYEFLVMREQQGFETGKRVGW